MPRPLRHGRLAFVALTASARSLPLSHVRLLPRPGVDTPWDWQRHSPELAAPSSEPPAV